MADEHRVVDAILADVGIRARQLPLVGESGEASISAGDVASRVSKVANVGAVIANHLDLLDPGMRNGAR